MAAGPSKEELEMYWQNSRQYFDELARHYEKADPAYYKEFIQPFYSNPFRSKGSNFSEGIYAKDSTKKGGGPGKALAAAALIAMLVIGAAAFVLIMGNSSSDNDHPTNLKENATADTIITQDITEPPPVKDKVPKRNINFLKGEKMFEEKYYEEAARHLKRVPESDKDYKDAQRLLEIIKTMDKQKETGNNKNKRMQPVQPVR